MQDAANTTVDRGVLDTLPDGVVAVGADGCVLATNRVARRMLGLPGDMDGALLTEVLRLVDQHGNTWVASNRPFEGLSSRTGVPEQSWLLPDGQEVLTRASILRAERGGPVTGVTISLRGGRGRARLDRERSDLVATVAHELRSPLTGVKGFVQALLNRWDRLDDDQRKLMLATVYADSERLSRLIAELLDVARLDTGRLSLYPRPCDAAVLLGRVVESISAATARRIDLVVGEDLPEIQADPDKFTQVFTNLIENGVRHGAGLVTVKVVRVAREPQHPGVRIVVEDEGGGIPMEMRHRVFTKFWRSGLSGGSGLGLYIVNGLVRVHGGALGVGETPSGGARITVDWPAADGDF